MQKVFRYFPSSFGEKRWTRGGAEAAELVSHRRGAGFAVLNLAPHVGGVEAFLYMHSVPVNVPTLDLHKFKREHINMPRIAL